MYIKTEVLFIIIIIMPIIIIKYESSANTQKRLWHDLLIF